jgi:5-methylcytosine-specific restriction endonuclease McrA
MTRIERTERREAHRGVRAQSLKRAENLARCTSRKRNFGASLARGTRQGSKISLGDGHFIQDTLIKHKGVFDNSRMWWRRYFRLRNLFYETPEWKSLTRRVRVKYKHVCARCENPGQEVHHSKEIFLHPELMLTFKFLVLLCGKCHRKHHKEEKAKRGRLSRTYIF